MNITKTLTALVVAIAMTTGAMAQNPMSPYSKYGYGILRDNATSSQRAMGGVGYAMNGSRQVNAMNPASYAAIDSLTFLFDMGLSITSLWSKEGDKSGKDFGGGLDYITMQFPIGKYLGASIGLVPYSSVGYSFGSKIDNGADSRSGSGGLNQLYVGFAGRPIKGLSIGANVGYLFGTNINSTYAMTTGGSTTLFQHVVEVRDYHLQFGAQSNIDLNNRDRLTFGLTYSPGKTLLGHSISISWDQTDNSTVADTLGRESLRGRYSLPDSWGFGVSYQWNNRLTVEADVTYQPWKDAKYARDEEYVEPTRFNDRTKYAVGLQYVPNPRGSYFRRVNYRAGAFYSNDYLNINSNKLRSYGASIGFGFPTADAKTVINLGIDWQRRQATPNPLIKENYLTVTLGVNFNELWFYQRKIR